MTDMCRAAVLMGPGELKVLARPDPEPGAHQVVIRVWFAGICGTDLALHRGEYGGEYPIVLGHEFCGEVETVGVGVPEEWVGAFVTAEINLTCLTGKKAEPCAMCRRSLSNHCLNRRALGIRGADGAFADRVVVPVGTLHRLPNGLSPWAAVLVEPVAAALRTFELTPVEPGETVVVLGAGRLGLLVALVARSYGTRVICISREKRRRDLATRFGANEALPAAAEETLHRVRELTEGVGADLVVDCTGRPDGLARALVYVRALGVVAVKTTCGVPARDLYAADIVVREVTVQGSRCGPFGKAIERLAAGVVPVADYVSGVYPLDQISAAFDASGRATKILLEIDPPSQNSQGCALS